MSVENLSSGYSNNPFNYAKFEQVDRDIVTQWLTLDEITQQLNLFGDESQDSFLESLELATRMAIEDYLGMSIFSTKWKVYYGNFGFYNTAVFLDLPAVSGANQGQSGVTISSVDIYTTSNTSPTTVSSDDYSYDPTGNRVILDSLPGDINTYVANPVTVTYYQNASPMSQYPVIKQAGLLLLTHLYNNRSNSTDKQLHDIPYGVATLLRLYKPLVM
jgi:hypothetical protein